MELTMIPQKITAPRSAPIIPAAAMGPGVGGTREWVEVTPNVKATVVAANGTLLFKESDLLIGLIMTNALSPNTGIDNIQPVIIIASITDFSPIQDNTF